MPFATFSTKQLYFLIIYRVGKLYERVILNYHSTRQVMHIIRAYLSNRTFKYRLESTIPSVPSRPESLKAILFSLYTSDIPRYPQVELPFFADDIVLCGAHYLAMRRQSPRGMISRLEN